MKKLPKIIVGAIWMFLPLFSPGDALAVTVASQTAAYSDPFYVWETLQELGNNLSGTVSSFTFRVSTSNTNLNQFDYTTQNTRIYDKDNSNSYIIGCIPAGASSAGPLRGLTFTTSGVPPGFEDVTIDFSCRNYNFITGHRYLILISNANIPQYGGKTIRFAAASYSSTFFDNFSGGGLRYANGNPWDYYYNSGSCNPETYVWNDQTRNPTSGCNIWNTAKDDLYFILSNTSPPPPPPRLPVIFIPGIGGSEMKTAQDIIWSAQDGHGGTYSHAYSGNEKIWVNQDEAAKLGDDDYFDVLKLKTDGVTSEAALSLTGNLTSFGYPDIDSFFTGMGYVKNTNFFIFPYDWRKDVRTTKDGLDSLIESAKTASGQSKVNLVVHSMGGLVARYYISDPTKASKVNKLIELGVPHLGSVDSLKTLRYGSWLGYDFKLFTLGLPPSETKDVIQNMPSAFQLIPSLKYYDFYNNSDSDHPYPFRDDRDIDNNKEIGSLNFSQTKSLLNNLGHNMTTFDMGEQYHNSLDPISSQTNGTKIYEIIGTAQPTLGQIHETWWITWPVNLLPKTDEIFINGDGTVPLYSASLKNDSLDISGATKIYYTEQGHGDLVTNNGTAMQTVKAILNDDNAFPVEVKDQKLSLEGQQISVDGANLDIYDDLGNHTGLKSNGDLETNIVDTFYDSIGATKHIFVKKSKKVTAKITSSKTTKTNIKIRNYSGDSITKTILYKDIPVASSSAIQLTINPGSSGTPALSDGTQILLATSEATGSAALDQTPPVTSIQISGTKDAFGIFTNPVIVTLTGSDSESGILKIEYSVDNGQTVQTYAGPFIISAPGKTTLQVKSIDKSGNEEIPQTLTIQIAVPPAPSPNPTPSPSPSPIPAPAPTASPSPSPSPASTPAPTASPVPIPGPTLIATTLATAYTPGVGSDSQDVLQESNGVNHEISPPAVLGTSFKNSGPILDEHKKPTLIIPENSDNPRLSAFLIIFLSLLALIALGLTAAFRKPSQK